jgi:hypothetical protein
MIDTSRWSWDERMGKEGDWRSKLTSEDKAQLVALQEDMELKRLVLVDAKTDYDRACDAVYVFVRSKRESH